MKLPNADRAVVEIEKLRDYCLSASHPRGRHKARVFVTALGITAENSEEATPTDGDKYGQRYMVDFRMVRQDKQADIRTTWIVRTGEDDPRLTSCYVL